MRPIIVAAVAILVVSACSRLDQVGKAPDLNPVEMSPEHIAMNASALPRTTPPTGSPVKASLWSGGRQSLLGDRRAQTAGDILTVVIEIDDKAEFQNSSKRARGGSEEMGVPNFLGLPQSIDRELTDGASMANAVSLSSSSSSNGNGSVKRNEKLELRVAATVIGTLPNGVLKIQGTQEVRVNFELRELLVTGFVRPQDISRQNEISYDKIASARISYGGRGQITDVQQPRYGQQITDIILPF
ncbi:flagellar basal body L-ring protein FlgH [Aliiroseovarius sediminis]|uniref:flagellar basal body L-ring protein FlgH n=1 Tax=Aliiroseovarius sediminis TaxID=2925839 RepID=UPI001F574524|nr:flagellar basal body L-ring protein FlgH [Aliiroseovarius sediminis]MCI2394755.1 flagellar basal body L-ring protein FlgH [Aliiroseovarius sediminis]